MKKTPEQELHAVIDATTALALRWEAQARKEDALAARARALNHPRLAAACERDAATSRRYAAELRAEVRRARGAIG